MLWLPLHPYTCQVIPILLHFLFQKNNSSAIRLLPCSYVEPRTEKIAADLIFNEFHQIPPPNSITSKPIIFNIHHPFLLALSDSSCQILVQRSRGLPPLQMVQHQRKRGSSKPLCAQRRAAPPPPHHHLLLRLWRQ